MRRDFLKLCALVGLSFVWPENLSKLLGSEVKEEAPYDGPY